MSERLRWDELLTTLGFSNEEDALVPPQRIRVPVGKHWVELKSPAELKASTYDGRIPTEEALLKLIKRVEALEKRLEDIDPTPFSRG